MTFDEYRQLAGVVDGAWTEGGWSDVTLRLTLPRFLNIPLQLAIRAVGSLFEEGREFPPPPSIVLARCNELAVRDRLYLPPPDSCRDADADERARMERWRLRLRQVTEQHLRRGHPQRRGEAVHSPEEG